MDAHPFPAIDADLPGLLRRTHAQAGEDVTSTIAEIGTERTTDAITLMGALCIGGVGLAARLVSHRHPAMSDDEQTGVVLDAFNRILALPTEATAESELLLAEWLVDGFDLQTPAEDLFDLVRAEFLIDRGPVSELPVAVKGAMDHQDWALALRGLERQRQELQADTPRSCFGRAAICLHHLGRYAEANQWMHDGLGQKQAALIAIPPVKTEAELLARWGNFDKPVVSIICTTYNHERYIESAIRGFLSQDCEYPFEILIHDDASTDKTQDVIRAWQQRYPAIIKPVLQAVNQKSQGVRPFETMLARAQGDFVATCEGDDFWIDPAKLQRQVGFLMEHPEYSCSSHNYHHFIESTLTVRPWRRSAEDFVIPPRQLMCARWLLWLPTLVFRKTFSTLPAERAQAAFGDQFLTSYLGTFGPGKYFETMVAAVRRENQFSTWSPLPDAEKERRRVKTWIAMLRMHERLGNAAAIRDLTAKVVASPLEALVKASLLQDNPPAKTPDTDVSSLIPSPTFTAASR